MFLITIPYLDLNKTYESNQNLKWLKLHEDKYIIIHKDNSCLVQQQPKNKLLFHCNDEQFFSIWYDYFDISTDYSKVNSDIKALGGYFKNLSVISNGVRIINQDLYECVIGQITKSNYTLLCEMYGTKHVQSFRECGKHAWYETPNADQLKSTNDEQLLSLSQSLQDDHLDLESLKSMKYITFKQSVSNVIVEPSVTYKKMFIYGNHGFDLFPKSKAMKHLVESKYDMSISDFEEWALDGLENKAILYQYMVYDMMKERKGL